MHQSSVQVAVNGLPLPGAKRTHVQNEFIVAMRIWFHNFIEFFYVHIPPPFGASLLACATQRSDCSHRSIFKSSPLGCALLETVIPHS